MILNIVFFLINILILAIIYILLRRRLDRLTEPERITDALAGDLDIILSEINQATERNILIIEDKIKDLESVISTAEDRIKLLKKQAENESSRAIPGRQTTPVPDQKPEGGQLDLAIPPDGKSRSGEGELTYSHLSKMNAMSDLVTPLSVPGKSQPEGEDYKGKGLFQIAP